MHCGLYYLTGFEVHIKLASVDLSEIIVYNENQHAQTERRWDTQARFCNQREGIKKEVMFKGLSIVFFLLVVFSVQMEKLVCGMSQGGFSLIFPKAGERNQRRSLCIV